MKIGDKVHWTHYGKNCMTRKEGVIENIEGESALIKCGKRSLWIELIRLRLPDEKSDISLFVEAIAERNRMNNV